VKAYNRVAVIDADVDVLKLYKMRADFIELMRAGGPLEEYSVKNYKPLEHQRIGTNLIMRCDAVNLSWDMRTGKTKAVIDAIVALQLRRVLVVCPAKVVGNWGIEWAKHGSDTYRLLLLLNRAKSRTAMSIADRSKMLRNGLSRPEPLIAVINYESVWQKEFGELVAESEWDIIVADEIQRIKDSNGKCSKFFSDIRFNAARRVGMSGTPVWSTAIDLFAQMRFLDPGIFGSGITEFKAQYCHTNDQHRVLGYKNLDDLRKRFAQISFRVRREDVLDLVEIQDQTIEVELSEGARKVYESIRDSIVTETESGTITVQNALVEMLRLQQVTSGSVRFDDAESASIVDTAKEDALEAFLEELPIDEPVVVFCLFKHELKMIRRICERIGRSSCELSGARNDFDDWRAPDLITPDELNTRYRGIVPTILAAQIQSGGVGLEMTRACYNVWLSTGFSYGLIEQSRARSLGPNQKRPVTYLTIVAKNTIDSVVHKVLRRKARDAARIVETSVSDLEPAENIGKELLEALKQSNGGDFDGEEN
jgi:non-specific serine/threonine protein kinase